MKVVIVGGVAGGASAAARIRRLDEHAQIIMIERSGYVSYANCGLPYYVGGVIKEQEELTLQTPESFWDRFRIDVRVQQEATAINPTEKTVTVHALDSGKVYTETYDKLLLAPGAKPTVPALSGVDSERVFTLRTVEDTLRIRRFVEDQKPKTAVLAGGGFIGLEMAENLVEMGVSVTIVQRLKQLLAPLDADMASFVHAEMRRHGVALRLDETVTGFRQDGDSVLTLLEESEPLRSDMVLLAIGVTPDTHLAKEAGLELGIRGSIAVNERMETSVPDIYAVGDAVEVTHFVTGQKALISLAGPANKQGRIAADNICGGNSRFHGSQGSSVLKLFGLTAASTGINEKAAQAAGIAYDKVVLFPASHAIISLFRRNDPVVIEIGTLALRMQLLTLPLQGTVIMGNMMPQSIGYGFRATLVSTARQGIFLIPLLIVLTLSLGLLGIQCAQPLADIATFLLALFVIRGIFKEFPEDVSSSAAQ